MLNPLVIVFIIGQLLIFSGQVSTLDSLVNPDGFSSAEQETTGPVKKSDSLGMKITAKSAIVIDKATGSVLFEKNANERTAMASLTKVMTGIVALESGANLDDTVLLSSETVGLEGANVGLEDGEEIRAKDLLYGTLIASGNDAAVSLAKYIGRDVDSFVAKMNQQAQVLGLNDTRFKNPCGLDADNHFSTARDLAKLFDYATDNNSFREIIAMQSYDANALNKETVHHFETTNKLFDIYLDMKGGKTGFTDEAMFSFVSLFDNGQGNEIIVVVLGSDLNGNQFQDTKALADWTFRNYNWK